MPNDVVYVSTTAPPADTVVIAAYRAGEASDQSFGLATVTVWVTVAVLPAATEVAGDVAAPTELAIVTDWALVVSFWIVTAMATVALVDETCGVVTAVPV